MVSSHVPSAAQYPRRGDGRKGAYRRRDAMAPAPPCPRHHDEHSGQDEGTGQEQGRMGESVRALCVPYVGVIYGLSRLITVN
jgi:hypothetical protein